MSTRATVSFKESGCFLIKVYIHSDGNRESLGKRLIEFVNSKELVNGFNNQNQFNGVGCMAAFFVKQFKAGTGGLYIVPSDFIEDYNYTVSAYWNTKNELFEIEVTEGNDIIFSNCKIKA